MKLYIGKDYDEVSRKTAELVMEEVRKKPNLLFCLPAGASPIGMYKELVEAYKMEKISFKDMITFDMDEYVGISNEHPKSFAHFMQEHFLQYVDVKNNNVYYPDGLADDLNLMCKNYSAKMKEFGGLDLAISGIGDDGHVAFNEPNNVLYPKTHVIDLVETTRIQNAHFFDNDLNTVPKKAITVGMEEILKSKLLIIVASGKKKAPLMKRTLEEQSIDPNWPISFARLHPNCIFIVDEEAMSTTNKDVLNDYDII